MSQKLKIFLMMNLRYIIIASRKRKRKAAIRILIIIKKFTKKNELW